MWLLRDPWQLSKRQLIFPQALAQMLPLCDGTRTPEMIQHELSHQLGINMPFSVVDDALGELDRAFLLHNDRFESERERHLQAYRAQVYRPPALAGLGYPAEPSELTTLFQGYANGTAPGESDQWRGIVSPHIDYQRGGPVYGRVWRAAAPSVLEADLVLIFGTDHNGRSASLTLTRQPYATPYGVLPTDLDLIDQLAAAIGEEAAYREELNHRNEHSVELSAVWLHHVFHQAGQLPCPMIPILVGSFHHFVTSGTHPQDSPTYRRFLDALCRATAGRRILTIASVDLAHVGPAFGDTFDMDVQRRTRLRREDEKLMEALTDGNAPEFYRQIAQIDDRNRICGFAPLYLMLRYLESSAGVQIAYAQCPADQSDTSLVSICGLLLK
ncbi:MAG: AmmeMemoRadiSam system protein B [Anaerolineales bacterium]|uniref:AmmeMemoRadiSam system protein B n=1 Tax=Promineifilum sp. TaxID=2664178 RepID=UPI001DA6E5B5|nr:AmmeMemoRadiSam system protein B [Anaerolineales bacterium]MCO5179490.1 AmmeMemoRadiSam system protein B [Promineifilum sp.]